MGGTVKLVDLGTTTGQTGREYRGVGLRGECSECGRTLSLVAFLDPAEPIPEGYWHHQPDGSHVPSLTGDSEAARALRDGRTVARYDGRVL